MLIGFFLHLREAGLPVSIREFLDLLAALRERIAFASLEDFYFLSRACLVKEEKYFDRFDRAFGAYFEGLEMLDEVLAAAIPEDWLRKQFEENLTDEEKARIEALGGLDKLMEEFRKRLEEQRERHEGGNRWIGTGGTSPFGAYGYNPEGIRLGQEGGRNRSAVKVWDRRQYQNLDDSVELGTRNIKVALRRLRRFARTGAQEELDLDDTISSTARNAGLLDIRMVPERHNAVKVLLFLDIGGSMDPHVRVCEELFSAARSEFKHLEYFYFHNFIYESVWKDNLRRHEQRATTFELLHKYPKDYKVVFVGDASMAPYEITHPGGSVEHYNEEAGATWMQRLADRWDKLIWLNPTPEKYWDYTPSIEITRQLVGGNMFPLTLRGIEDGIRFLSR